MHLNTHTHTPRHKIHQSRASGSTWASYRERFTAATLPGISKTRMEKGEEIEEEKERREEARRREETVAQLPQRGAQLALTVAVPSAS